MVDTTYLGLRKLASFFFRHNRHTRRAILSNPDCLIDWGFDGLTIEDSFLNVAAAGNPGSGKSSCLVNMATLRALALGYHVFWTTAKTTDIADGLAIAKLAGVPAYVTGPYGNLRMHVMESIIKHSPDKAAAVSDFLYGLSSMAFNGQMNEEKVWDAFSKEQTYAAACILLTVYDTISPQMMGDFISDATSSDPDNFHNETMNRLRRKLFSKEEAIDLDSSVNYFKRWVTLNDRTQSSILANTMASLNILNRGELRTRLSSDAPNFRPETFMEIPSLWISGYPTAALKDTGRLGQAADRFCLQTYLLNRKDTSKPVLVVMDECHQHVNVNDLFFLAMSRSQRVSNLVAFQNKELLEEAFSSNGKAKAEAFLSLMGSIFMFQSQGASAQWGEERVGRALMHTYSSSTQRDWSKMPDMWNPQASRTNASVSEQYLPILPATVFSSLKRPHPEPYAECVVMGTRPLEPHGKPYAKVRLPQLRLS